VRAPSMSLCRPGERGVSADPFELAQMAPLVHDRDGKAVAQVETDKPGDRRAGPAVEEIEPARRIDEVDQSALAM